jgi:hypothetical protein
MPVTSLHKRPESSAERGEIRDHHVGVAELALAVPAGRDGDAEAPGIAR